MSTAELKSSLHKIVETIQDEQLLQTIYDFLKTSENNKPGKIWESLTADQKNEVLLAFEESENESNLVESSVIFKNTK